MIETLISLSTDFYLGAVFGAFVGVMLGAYAIICHYEKK
jgi:hypothetical protein